MNPGKMSHWLSIVAKVGLFIGHVLVIYKENSAQQKIRPALSQGRTDAGPLPK
jgi:hypothetical protein